MPVTPRLSPRFCEGLGEDVPLAGLRADLRRELGEFRCEVRTHLSALRRELVFEMFVWWVLNLVCTASLLLAFRWH